MSILHWADFQTPRNYMSAEDNPYALPIIVRVEKDGTSPSHEEVLLAVAKGMAYFFDDARNAPGGWWRADTLTWLEGRIRKVARRARGKEWETLRNMEHVYAAYGKAEIIILPPHTAGTPPVEVKKLQVSGLELPHDYSVTGDNAGIYTVVDSSLNMSTGKSAAQVGHAVQISIFHSDRETLLSWRDNGFPVSLCNWNDYNDCWSAVIHDAGFTEIPSGSRTAKGRLWY